MHAECCICLNEIEEPNVFVLECCNNIVHHDCMVNWINTNITKPTYEEVKSEETKIIQGLPYKKLREERGNLLLQSDIYGLTDFPFTSDTKKQEWMTYRQNLRDLPTVSEPKLDSNGKLYNITWPNKPSSH